MEKGEKFGSNRHIFLGAHKNCEQITEILLWQDTLLQFIFQVAAVALKNNNTVYNTMTSVRIPDAKQKYSYIRSCCKVQRLK